ncbi:hypothetical protein DICSQDRAFT_99304 [Dichomitus squalens LYAD-421 SS1]|uniref:uncharacterized protein n=1 Tax=Dichomitus squalens (strain LYAD-421) TaxID=732165 RepID=UPI00044109D1|nr:uncharacterized protein DICSQDRAFT_99304 [Dichomitus squalens LYAD-421 SS1]EJF65453.1 hypothetical protein DICSQDRAFT_99304 [Dichomitus squalens LYAD-421 SS1]
MPRAKKARTSEPTTAPESGAEGSTSGATAHGSEKAQTTRSNTRRNIRGRRGGLKDMPNMPIDILIEIFRHMHPRDLLNLARTTKDFRAFLMKRSSAPFWKAARQQVNGLPECPAHLTEPAYANLVFFFHCHECLKPNVKNVIWEFSVRYCSPCKGRLVEHSYRPLPYDMIQEVREVTSVDWGYLNEYRAATTKGSRYKDLHYLNSEAAEFRAKWTSLSTDEEKKTFIAERVEAVKQRKEFADQMCRWQKAQEHFRSQELDTIKEARFEAICKRLADEGWAEELELMDKTELAELSWQKAARKSQKLTDYGWRSIRAELHHYMETVRTKRLDREQHNMLCARLVLFGDALREYQASKLPRTADTDWHPFLSDYAMMPQVREVIEAPPGTAVTKEMLLALCEAQIPALTAKWYDDRKREFAAQIRKKTEAYSELKGLPEDPDCLLSLAIATFRCTSCQFLGMRWPQVLSHRCGRGRSIYGLMFVRDGKDHQYRHAIGRTCMEYRFTHPWSDSKNVFSFNDNLKQTCAVISACGKDPAKVTFEEMEACGVRLLCRGCQNAAHALFKATYCRACEWKNAVSRHEEGPLHWFAANHEPDWVRLDAEHTRQVLRLEASQREKFETSLLASPVTTFGCTQCRFRAIHQAVLEHYATHHGKKTVAFGTDYYIHMDNRPYVPEPIRIYPEGLRDSPEVVDVVKSGRGFTTAAPLF